MLKKIWAYLGKYKAYLFLIFLFSLLGSALALLAPSFIGKAIDSVAIAGNVNFKALTRNLLILILLYSLSFVFTRLAPYFASIVANKSARDIRNDAFSKLSKLPISYYDSHKHGNIISILTVDIDNMTEGLLGLLTQLLVGLITIIGTLVLLTIMSPLVALTVLIVTPLSIVIARFITKRSSKMYARQQELIGNLTSLAEETLSGLNVAQAYLLEDDNYKAFENINAKLYDVGQKAQFYSSLVNPSARFVNHISYVLVGVIGSYLALLNGLSIGQIAAMLSYATQFAKPINEITSVTSQIQNAIASINRVFSLIDEEAESSDRQELLKVTEGKLVFDKVSFGYDKLRPPLLNDLTIDVPGNSIIAIVGPTGAGKSTLVNLLMRFYDISKGRITIDNVDIFSVSRDSLRTSFAMVLQELWIFKGTVYDNIAFGNPSASFDQVVEAAKKAHIHSYIEKLPQAYDTIIDQEDLSQGQLQLLTIARAMLVDPPILILDEATSNVDTRTEEYIQEALKEMMKGRTSFVIAHRLSTIRDADLILVMKDGDIVEKGKHKDLIAAKGLYYDLYKKSLTNE